MKKTKLLTLVTLCAVSTLSLASGSHSGGHHGGHDEAKGMSMGAHWMSPAAEAAKVNPISKSPSSIAKGSKLYQTNCAACHGEKADGKGMAGMMLNPKPADLVAMSGGHPDGDFAYKIKQGRGAMPAWKSILNDEQVWHLVNYIQTLKDKPDAHEEEGHGHSGGHH